MITKNERYTDLSGKTLSRYAVRELKKEGQLVDNDDGLLPGHSQTLRLK